MKFKDLEWKKSSIRNEYISDVSIKGLFGIRFKYGKTYTNRDDSYYSYIINGKKFGGYFGFPCNSLEEGKKLCEEKYIEICNKIIDNLCE